MQVTPQPLDTAFAADVLAGLGQTPKRLSSKYFYDSAGSDLFQQITQLPEYYLTRTEEAILRQQGPQLAQRWAGETLDVLELGAGDGTKTALLLEAFLGAGVAARYLPIDISEKALADLSAHLAAVLPTVPVAPQLADWGHGLEVAFRPDRRRLVLFLGSNIGNLLPEEAESLFALLYARLGPGDALLVGFDRVKDPAVLVPAYADSAGVTAQFNLNLLRRMNRELGADFDTTCFRHFATYNPARQAMESYLLSTCVQQVHVGALGRTFRFEAWEALHLEYSHKFTLARIGALGAGAGFQLEELYQDPQGWFADALFTRM